MHQRRRAGDQCLPPGPTPVYLLLRDSVTGRSLLDAPARYRPDSIRVLYPYATAGAPEFDTVGGDTALVVYQNTPSSCGGTNRKTGPWARIALRLDAATTDSLAIDRTADPANEFEYRYNGRRYALQRNDSVHMRTVLVIRK